MSHTLRDLLDQSKHVALDYMRSESVNHALRADTRVNEKERTVRCEAFRFAIDKLAERRCFPAAEALFESALIVRCGVRRRP